MSDDLVNRLGARKSCTGFKSGPSEDGGHMVCAAQYGPDALCAEAAAALVAKDAEIARLTALSAVLSSDADAARRASANNYERATAQSRLVADRETDCTRLMAALHHETGLREDAEAEIARLREALRDIAETSNYTRSEWMQERARSALLAEAEKVEAEDVSDDDWKADLSLMQYNALKGKMP